MKITAIPHGLDLAQSFGDTERAPGVHMSDLYNALYQQLEPKRYGKQDDKKPLARFELGMALEEFLEAGLKARLVKAGERMENVDRPGEFETAHTKTCKVLPEFRRKGMGCWCGGGVIYSPDLLVFNCVTRLAEIKLSSMSSKGIPWELGEVYTSFDVKLGKYLTQIKLYAFHLGTLFARLYMFSIREMVYFNEDAIFRAWDIEFTQQELREEWEWVLDFSRKGGLLTHYNTKGEPM